MVGRFLGSTSFDSRIDRTAFANFMLQATKRCADGKAAWLANILGVSKSMMHGWTQGMFGTEFSRIVSIADKLGCEIADIFQGNCSNLQLMSIPRRARKISGRHPFDFSRLDSTLESFLHSKECLSVYAIANLIGTSYRTLYKRAPELTKKLASRNKAMRRDRAASALSKKEKLMRQVVGAMVDERQFPTTRRVVERLGKDALPLFRSKDKLLFKKILAEGREAARRKVAEEANNHNLSPRAKQP